jgi:uncharacterized membrane protein SpoIIM required for sporulation
VKELRWLLLALALVEAAGAVVGWRAGMHASFDAMVQDPEGLGPLPLSRFRFPFTGTQLWGQGWAGYFGPNSLRAIYAWCYSLPTLGMYAIGYTWYNGWHLGWITCGSLPVARACSDIGPATLAAASLLPHGVVEIPAFLFAEALGLRAGLAWIWRLPGHGRWASVRRQARDFRIALLWIIPALLVAALLETYPASFMRNHYLLGVGLKRGLSAENRVFRPKRGLFFDGVYDFALSPSGDSLVWLNGNRILLLARPGYRARRLAEVAGTPLDGPAWSPDGKQIAVVSSPFSTEQRPDRACQLLLIDAVSGGKRVISNHPILRFYAPAWSPNGEEIAVRGVSPHPDASGKRPSDIWVVRLDTGRWRQLTRFPASTSVHFDRAGPAWSPDGRSVAFTRKTGIEDSYQIWVVRPDGTGLRQLTRGARDAGPAWSPDGRWIAFRSCPPEPDWEKLFDESSPWVKQEFRLATLSLIRPDGKGRIDGLVKADETSHLGWSRDSKSLYYTRFLTLIKGTPPLP